eukprot:260780-Amphidinium_carterae.1
MRGVLAGRTCPIPSNRPIAHRRSTSAGTCTLAHMHCESAFTVTPKVRSPFRSGAGGCVRSRLSWGNVPEGPHTNQQGTNRCLGPLPRQRRKSSSGVLLST